MLASVVLLAALAQEPSPDIDPAAQKVMHWMAVKYAALQTLRCTVCEPSSWSSFRKASFVPRARFVYRKPGSILIQRFGNDGPDREKVMREVRLWRGQITLSSPANARRYLAYPYEPKPDSGLTVWDEIANRAQAPVRELGGRIEGPRPDFPGQAWKTVRMKLDAPIRSADGTPVYVVEIDRRLERDGKPTGATVHRSLQIGQADGLLRKSEWEVRPPVRHVLQSGAEEYRDIVANRFEPDATFVFRPTPGMVAVSPPPWPQGPVDPRIGPVVEALRRALTGLKTLSFTSEIVATATLFSADGKGEDETSRAKATFELARPLLAVGELRVQGPGWGHLLRVVCDGTHILGWSENGRQERLDVDSGSSVSVEAIPGFANVGMPMSLGVSDIVVRLFFGATSTLHYFDRYWLGKPVVIGDETYDVLETSYEASDENGIPDGLVSTTRILINRKDHLIHRYEWDHPFHFAGRLHRSRTTERLTLATDLPIIPEKFILPNDALASPHG